MLLRLSYFVSSLVLLVLSLCGCAVVQGAQQYLKERPEFLKPCKLHAANNGECLAGSIQSIFQEWQNGIPGLERIGTLEPFRVKKVRIAQQLDSVALQLELRNMSTYGLSQSKILNSTIDAKSYTYAFNVQLPKVKIESDYRLRGRILLLAVNGSGTMFTDMSDLDYSIVLNTQLKQIDGEYFFELGAVRTNVLRVGGFHILLRNLFGGNKDLEDSAHQLFNAVWRDIFEVLRPVLSQTYDAVLQARFRKIFEFIPARYFFDDLP